MKKLHSAILLAVLVGLVASMAACKPSENTYRKAYESAKNKRAQAEAEDSTVFTAIRREAIPGNLAVGDLNIPTKTEIVSLLTDDNLPPETIKKYNVVVGQFKQIFNARSMVKRLQDGNYPGAFILKTREPVYYVIARVGNTPEEAARAWQAVKADQSMILRDPMPWILIPFGRK